MIYLAIYLIGVPVTFFILVWLIDDDCEDGLCALISITWPFSFPIIFPIVLVTEKGGGVTNWIRSLKSKGDGNG